MWVCARACVRACVRVISILQTSILSGAAKDQGYALRVGEGRKIAAHKEVCQAVGVSFVPIGRE